MLSKDIHEVIAVLFNVWTINFSKYVNSTYGMSSLIIEDIYIEVNITCNIKITASNRACHIFYIIFPHFWSHFVEMRPRVVTLKNLDGTFF